MSLRTFNPSIVTNAFNPSAITPPSGEVRSIGWREVAGENALLVFDLAGGGGGGSTTPAVFTTIATARVTVPAAGATVAAAFAGTSRKITIRNEGDSVSGVQLRIGASFATGQSLDPGAAAGRAGDAIVLNTTAAVTMFADAGLSGVVSVTEETVP